MIFILIFTLFRLATLIAFLPEEMAFYDLIPSFILGFRYDVKWISIIILPILLVSLNPDWSPFYSEKNKKIWTWYLAIMTFLVFFFFAADYGCFSYNKTRLNASALNFVEDANISFAMLWQSYPMFWMITGLVVAVIFFRWMYRRSHWNVVSKTDGMGIVYRRRWFYVSTFILVFFIYGNIGSTPLKWKTAFELKDSFKSYLALNPLQNFFSTLKFRTPQFNETKAREYFAAMANWLQIPDKESMTYRRELMPGSKALESRPNIVLVLCESFSMYKSSMSGNPLNSTPYFNDLTKQGIFFEKCFTPHFSTARGLFALITGIPDVQLSKFSTRNPEALKQHTIINNFEGYEKYYFLGGSPEFNNFEGLMKNVEDVQMMTGEKFNIQKNNVWGISDKNLFLEADKTFSKIQKPFFAIIQTADNHRPFMIPKDEPDFQIVDLPKDSLKKYGFESVEEFNSFRYSDYCFKKFIETAKTKDYFHNTIFVFIGDHGVSGNAEAIYPKIYSDQRLTDEHVPLLFYAPYLLHPQKHGEVVSQVDVLPTIAGMMQQSYVNTTLGRDLLNEKKKNNGAFVIHHDEGKIGFITDDYYFIKNLNFPNEELIPMRENEMSLPQKKLDSIQKQLSNLTTGYYETAKWMLLNNKK